MSANSGEDNAEKTTLVPEDGRNRELSAISCAALGNGNGRSSTPLMMANMAAFAPRPSASVRTAVAVKAGCLRNVRAP